MRLKACFGLLEGGSLVSNIQPLKQYPNAVTY